MENGDARLLIRIDERVKAIDEKLDQVISHNEKQDKTIEDHNTRITKIEAKTSGKKELILFAMWFLVIVSQVYGWIKILK